MHGITGGEILALISNVCDLEIFCSFFDYKTFLVRFVASLLNISEVDELQYTKDMINKNFSNYSAWHNRRYNSDLVFTSQCWI